VGGGEAERFPRKEFRRRMSERAGVSEAEAVRRARLVGEVLSRVVSREATDGLRDRLPGEYRDLLGRNLNEAPDT
jgi:uncharacterized protein (DUF2267 family)